MFHTWQEAWIVRLCEPPLASYKEREEESYLPPLYTLLLPPPQTSSEKYPMKGGGGGGGGGGGERGERGERGEEEEEEEEEEQEGEEEEEEEEEEEVEERREDGFIVIVALCVRTHQHPASPPFQRKESLRSKKKKKLQKRWFLWSMSNIVSRRKRLTKSKTVLPTQLVHI